MRDAIVRAIGDERAALLGVLAPVGGAEWDRPTVCTEWSVKDVLAHMVEGELNVGRVYRGELRESGHVDPEEGIARWRALPGEAVRAALWQHGIATQRVLDAMTDETWRAPIKIFGCSEVRQLVRLHLFDLVVHGHDLTDGLGLPPVWSARLRFVVEFVVRAGPFTLRRRRVPPEGALGLHVDGRSWTLDGREGDWSLSAEPAPATVTLPPEALVLATTGRRAVAEPPSHGAVKGDRATAERILGAWQVLG
jgi:uncharacterized protein (TIGR03083 family)